MTMQAQRDRARATTPGDDAAHAESLQRLDRALDRLPEDERLAIHLYYLEPDPVAAARSALDLHISAVNAEIAPMRLLPQLALSPNCRWIRPLQKRQPKHERN